MQTKGANSPDRLLIFDKNSINLTAHTIKAYYVGGPMTSSDLVNEERVTQGRDLTFDSSGIMYVTDAATNHLDRIDSGSGAVLAVIDNNDISGLAYNSKIQGLAYDSINHILVGANVQASSLLDDLVAMPVGNHSNATSFTRLSNYGLNEVQGQSFVPSYNQILGNALGTLIDLSSNEASYYQGDKPVLLMHDVSLTSAGRLSPGAESREP